MSLQTWSGAAMLSRRGSALVIVAVALLVLPGCYFGPHLEKHNYSVNKTTPRVDDEIYDVNVASLKERAPEIMRMFQEAERTGHSGVSLDDAAHERCQDAMKTYNPDPTGPTLHRYNGSMFEVSIH
jgi:hypothetical protein